MVVLVAGDLSVSSSDPRWVAGSGKVILGELGKSVLADRQSSLLKQKLRCLLELVLEVLEGQSVLKDGGVIDTRVTVHGPSVDGVGSGHSHGAHGGSESEQRSGQHFDLID